MKHSKLNYKTLEGLKRDIERHQYGIKISNNLESLKKEVKIGHKIIPNSLVYHPMEGGDALEDGSPSDLTIRKYIRYAKGGAGLIWIEAVSVCEEGRSNPGQLMLTKDNLTSFKAMRDTIVNAAKEEFGDDYQPITIVQLNHSGRYSKPKGQRKPLIATHKPILDEKIGIDEQYPLVNDGYLKQLESYYVEAALLCQEAGFDGVDIKACHGYLLGELLSAFEREGNYGGSFEKRTSLMLSIIDQLRDLVDRKQFIIGSRINLYDGVPYPQGWGVNKEDYLKVDLQEPIKLAKLLVSKGVELINITMGNPYLIPHVNRPYDLGSYYSDETPLYGNNRLIMGGAVIQREVPQAKVVGVGYSWFRQYAPFVAAGSLENHYSTLIGFGRLGIAYPDFAKDILQHNRLNKSRVCVSCSKCSELKKNLGTCGCVIRDPEIYLPMYKKMQESR